MKELKLRAWLKINNPLSKDNWISINKMVFSGNTVVGIGDKEGELYGIEEIELMQFTGLRDMNGKELYEGDIVKDNSHGRIMLVEWWRNGFCFKAITETNFRRACEIWQWCDWGENAPDLNKGDFEIIGNIYENTELLSIDAQNSIKREVKISS